MVAYYGQSKMTKKKFQDSMHQWWVAAKVDPRIIDYMEHHDTEVCRIYWAVATPELIAHKMLEAYHNEFGDRIVVADDEKQEYRFKMHKRK